MEEASALFAIGPVEISGVVVTSWVIIGLLALVAWLATRKLEEIPGPLQCAAEMAVESIENFVAGTLGREKARKYFPIFATFFIFIIVSNYSGLLPGAGHFSAFAVPTACLSVTAGLGIIAAVTTHTLGIKARGVKAYLKTFVKPFAFMLPLLLIEQVIRPLSLALRLYGNLYGEETVTHQLYDIFPIGLPVVINVLSLLFCLIQAMVFTLLMSIYVAEAVEEEEEE